MPRGVLAAGTLTLGAMFYAVVDAARRRSQNARDATATTGTEEPEVSSNPVFLSADGRRAANVPKYVLANSGLDNEQKLQVALCRRQAWLRAAQCAPLAALWSYAACVLIDSSGYLRLPRGSRTAAPLGAAVIGASVGAYYGGLEGKPLMNAALVARPVENVHRRRSERPAEEDSLLVFIREAEKSPRR
jgi:hypothetical protein